MKPIGPVRLTAAACVLSVVALAAEAPPPQSTDRAAELLGEEPGAGSESAEELHVAPQSQTGNAPPERQLTPPPDAEKALRPPGFVEVRNPAFPELPAQAPTAPFRGRRYERSDLSAYFRVGALAKAKSEFDDGHFAAARALLANQGNALPVRYLRALSGLRAGSGAAAAQEFTALAKDYPALRDRCLVHGALANEELRDWKEAAALFAKVPASSKLYVDARFGLARVRRALKDLKGAAEALGPIASLPAPSWGQDSGAEALLMLADLAKEGKEAAAERDALLNLWSNHPLSPEAANAVTRLRGKRPPAEAQLARGEQLIEAHRNQQGMALIKPLLPLLHLPDPLACRAHFAYGKALRKQRLHQQAIEALGPVVRLCSDPDLRVRALYVLASSQSIVDLAKGAESYERLAREYPAHAFADDALFYAADLYVRSGDPAKALDRLNELGARYPSGDFLSEALFKTFWIERSQKHPEAALEALARIEALFGAADETYDLERARYWRARMFEDAGNKQQAAEVQELLATDHPATYYGFLARSRLGDLDPIRIQRVKQALGAAPPEANPWPMFAGTLGEDPHFVAGVELLRMGFWEAAAAEFLGVNRTGQPPEALRLLVHALAVANDFRSAHAIARASLRRDLSGRLTSQNRPVWESAYPTAFRELVEKHCAEALVDPDLLQALMREESALDPKALSWAGALGLTQLMPSTAKLIAKSHKLRRVTQRMLLDPDWNIRLGALALGGLLQRFGGVQQYALAGYNAGPGAVSRWIAESPGRELDEWVEEIPIAETRGYVKRVLRSYNTYQLLYPKRLPVSARRER